MKPYFLLVIFMIASICSGSLVNAQINKDVKRKLQAKIPLWLSENNVPAAGIGIIENGKIKYVKVLFGELKKGVPASDNAIFNVASIMKTVVTMLTLKLVETEQWDLDETLSDYWIDPDVASDSLHIRLMIRHVLTHQIGFANWCNDNPDKKLKFYFPPGTKYQYSGEGFEYLGNALEHKFKRHLEKLPFL